jgi:SAM-dependent methyltransferase
MKPGLGTLCKQTVKRALRPLIRSWRFLSVREIQILHKRLVSESISRADARRLRREALARGLTASQFVHEVALSARFLRASEARAAEVHLNYINWARIQMISTLLPAAKSIIDLGGANGNVYDYGYPHRFERLLVVDLPPETRHEMYRELEVKPRITPSGPIHVKFSDMADLSFIESQSADLIWSGQSIEHITIEQARNLYLEIKRILRPGGFFCLDTPNRLITKIHTADIGGGFVHPDHKLEYTPQELARELEKAGFEIVECKGVCEMPRTVASGRFDYTDFVLGSKISDRIDDSYIQFYRCRVATMAFQIQR